MKVIGITGPSGSGKTTLAKILKENYSSAVIDADIVARKLSNDSTTEYFKKIVELFGKDILKDNKLNRKEMAYIIYKDKEKRNELNKLTFKYVVRDINKQIKEFKNNNFEYIVVDVPLLYEAKMEKICDVVIAVVAEDMEKVMRICKRDNVTEDIAKGRLKIQNDNEFFVKKADYTIHNDGTIEKMKKTLEEIINKI